MKQTFLIIIIALSSITLKAQEMNIINTKVAELFVASDERNWEKVETIFAEKVVLDYSSMNGNPAVELTPNQITTAWKGILPGFESTHHQLGNFITEVHGENAKVFCYGTATHYLTDNNGNLWTVVGSYNFDLKKIDNQWRITSMKFNFKYQDGNTSLPEKAIKNATK
jgi:hypothetical protein